MVAFAMPIGSACGRPAQLPTAQMFQRIETGSSGVVAIARTAPGQVAALCSGALVASNLVLTARHCVAHSLNSRPSCDALGRSHNGGHVEDVSDLDLAVYTGDAVALGTSEPVAHAIATVHPEGNILCDADVAFVLLDRPVTNVNILPLRLGHAVEKGDFVVPIGFGGGQSREIGTRVVHDLGRVLAVGPANNMKTGAVLGRYEFEVDNATCFGDSGGPAIDALTGEIVGVISRGASCTSHGNHVYTRIDAFEKLVTRAFAMSDRSALLAKRLK